MYQAIHRGGLPRSLTPRVLVGITALIAYGGACLVAIVGLFAYLSAMYPWTIGGYISLLVINAVVLRELGNRARITRLAPIYNIGFLVITFALLGGVAPAFVILKWIVLVANLALLAVFVRRFVIRVAEQRRTYVIPRR